MSERVRPWYFGTLPGDGEMPKQWLQMPVPVAAQCSAGCGNRIRIGDHGIYLYDPTTQQRHPAHYDCIAHFLHAGCTK